jgi:hypothetical protein
MKSWKRKLTQESSSTDRSVGDQGERTDAGPSKTQDPGGFWRKMVKSKEKEKERER